MKDYIDKLREDYHIKQVKKLRFGDKLRSKYYDMRYGDNSAPTQYLNEKDQLIDEKGTLIDLKKEQQDALVKENQDKISKSAMLSLGKPDMSYKPGSFYANQQEGQEKWLATSGVLPIKKIEEPIKKIEEPLKKIEEPIKKTEIPEQPSGFFIPPNGDLTTNLYNAGRAAKSGNAFGTTTNLLTAGIKGASAFLSGKGFQNMQNQTDQYNVDQLIAARKKYESNPQYKNTNSTGNSTESRNGGKINLFEEGGEQMDPRQAQMMQMMQQQQGQQEADPRQQQMDPRQAQMMQQQGQQQMDPRQAQMQQQQQETQMTEQESAAYQQIANKLVNSFETIEEIANYLKENKVDQVAYQAILNFAQDMIEDRDESKQENDDSTEEPQNEEEASEEMRKGGKKKFNKKVGEYIEFEYNGKVHKGTIKSIKNGQIFLK